MVSSTFRQMEEEQAGTGNTRDVDAGQIPDKRQSNVGQPAAADGQINNGLKNGHIHQIDM